MKYPFLVLVILVALAGCSKSGERPSFVPAQAGSASTSRANHYLAYQHSISIDAEENQVAAIFEAGQAACRDAVADSCVVLESQITAGRNVYASLKFRAKASGIQKLIGALTKQGEISARATSAEDLASPIEDASKKLAMLNDYRSKLEALLGRANSDVDALIKLNRELAQVQSELEAMTGKHAHLMQRVETEILNVSITSINKQSFWRPIIVAIEDFSTSLSQGISIAITSIAYLIPWGIASLFLVWASRKLWRRRKQHRHAD